MERVNVEGSLQVFSECQISFPPSLPLLENILPVAILWKLPEGDVDSLSGPLPGFVVSGSQETGGRLPLRGWGGSWDDKD